MSRFEEKTDAMKNSTLEIQPMASALLAFCRANQEHFRKLGMEVEARAFDDCVQVLVEDFGIPPSSYQH